MSLTLAKLGEACRLQGERLSIAYFANAREETVFQGPAKRWPAQRWKDIMSRQDKVCTGLLRCSLRAAQQRAGQQ